MTRHFFCSAKYLLCALLRYTRKPSFLGAYTLPPPLTLQWCDWPVTEVTYVGTPWKWLCTVLTSVYSALTAPLVPLKSCQSVEPVPE